jgi:hypothetical protein
MEKLSDFDHIENIIDKLNIGSVSNSCGIIPIDNVSGVIDYCYNNNIPAKKAVDLICRAFQDINEFGAFIMISLIHVSDLFEDCQDEYDTLTEWRKERSNYFKVTKGLKDSCYRYVPYRTNYNSGNRINMMIFKLEN